MDDFFRRLQSFFADAPYDVADKLERQYQNVLFILFRLAGFHVSVEYRTNRGRIDLLVQTSDYIYVMEFKLNGSPEEALAQINDKGYAEPFAADARHLLKIGVNFNSQTRNIDRWVVG